MAQQSYNVSHTHNEPFRQKGASAPKGFVHGAPHWIDTSHSSLSPGTQKHSDLNTVRTSRSFDANEAKKWTRGTRKNAAKQSQILPNDVLKGFCKQLQYIWLDDHITGKKAKAEAVYKKLVNFLSDSPNPWEFAFYLVTHVSDYTLAKTQTLSFTILEEFNKWVSSPDNYLHEQENEFLSVDLQMRVFYATTGKYMAYFSTAVAAFRLDNPGNDHFVPVVRAILLRSKLPEVKLLPF